MTPSSNPISTPMSTTSLRSAIGAERGEDVTTRRTLARIGRGGRPCVAADEAIVGGQHISRRPGWTALPPIAIAHHVVRPPGWRFDPIPESGVIPALDPKVRLGLTAALPIPRSQGPERAAGNNWRVKWLTS